LQFRKIIRSYRPESNPLPENPFKEYTHEDSLIFLLRHGQIQGHGEKRFIGATDVPLDDTGLSQTGYWQKAFSAFPLDTVYSSCLQRCDKMARRIAGNTPVVNVPALNEIHMGEWDGKTFEEIKACRPEEFMKRGQDPCSYRPLSGESFQDLSDRVLPFFNPLARKKEKILMVTHAGVIRVILCHVLNLPLKDLFQIKPAYGELFILG
jgi:probable phosphoglycerate mutase